jgi:magnesium chelatase family protein
MRISVAQPDPERLLGSAEEDSEAIRSRVEAARRIQVGRGSLNRSLTRGRLDTEPVDEAARSLLRGALEKGKLTGRGLDRVRRVARTIADLAGSRDISAEHVGEALAYRSDL